LLLPKRCRCRNAQAGHGTKGYCQKYFAIHW
jgi:hypothetical protein